MKNNFVALLAALGFAAWCLFTGCDSGGGQTAKVITQTVTNFATIFVTNTVIFTNEISSPIPTEYSSAYRIATNFAAATPVAHDKVLFQMKDIRTSFFLEDAVKQFVSEDEAKAKYELTLRRNGIAINSSSQNAITVTINGFVDDSGNVLIYNIQQAVIEQQWVVRREEFHTELVSVWEVGSEFGRVGKLKAEDAILDRVEKDAELFANDFLSANPKNNEAQK